MVAARARGVGEKSRAQVRPASGPPRRPGWWRSDRRDAAQEQRSANCLRQMRGGHVGTADGIVDAVIGAAVAGPEIGRVVRQQRDGAEADESAG